MEKFFREHLENNGRIYDKKVYPMNKINQVKVNAFPNLNKLSGSEKIELYDRYTEEMKDFAKHLVRSSADALKSLKEKNMIDQVTEETHEAANNMIMDDAMVEIKRLEGLNTDLRIKLSTIMTLTPAETLEIKSSKLYRKQRKKIKKLKTRVKGLTIEVFELRHMGDKIHGV